MADVYFCVKQVFLFFTLICWIAGSTILVFAEHGFSFQAYVNFAYAVGATTMVLSTLGMYGAHGEKKWALVVFLIGMSLLSVTLLALTVPLAVMHPKISAAVSTFMHTPLPLAAADPYSQQVADMLQSEMSVNSLKGDELECCGLHTGPQDWGKHIPDSCLCPERYRNSSKCVKLDLLDSENGSEKLVYKEPCSPVVMHHVIEVFDVLVGAGLGFSVLALIGMGLSMALLCHSRRQPQQLFSV